jgi:hypothetical protein
MDELITLKATAYDVALEIEGLQKKIQEAQERKKLIDIKIEVYLNQGKSSIGNQSPVGKIPSIPIDPVKANELRMKEQRILSARVGKVPGAPGAPTIPVRHQPADDQDTD